MPSFTQEKELNFSAKQMYDLVMDIEKYPEFLPWCKKGEIVNRSSNNLLEADLLIDFKNIYETYRSKVNHCQEGDDYFVDVEAISGPFQLLLNNWHFKKIDYANCQIFFHVEFEFNSKILTKLIGLIFKEASKKMVRAFEDRAREVYAKN